MTSPISRKPHEDGADLTSAPSLRLEGEPEAADAVLVARVREGDVAAFEAIVVAHVEAMVAFAWRYVGSSEAAADLAQDVFAHVWERRQAFVVRGTLRAYLFGAIRNRALDALKHERVVARWRENELRTDEDARVAPPADEDVEQAELANALRAAFAALPPRAQEVARLRWQERLSLGEIAVVMGITASTVSNQLTRAAKRMRALLAGVWP